jgi:hypothetical protein
VVVNDQIRRVKATDPLAIALVQQKQSLGAGLAELILTGLEAIIQQARAGDPAARAVCRRMAEAGNDVRGVAAVRLPGEPS